MKNLEPKNTHSKINSPFNTSWYVVYTKSRNEKKVAVALNERGIEAYCPTKTVESQWSDRKKKVEKPLFNSYCFVKLAEKDLRSVFAVHGVVRYIYWCGRPAIVKEEEIEVLKNWLNDFDHEDIDVQYFNINDRVIIKSGPFIDKIANVIKHDGNKMVLELKGLGVKITTKVNDTLLAKVG